MMSASVLFTGRRARAPHLSDPDPLADAPQDPHGLATHRHRHGCHARCQLDAARDALEVFIDGHTVRIPTSCSRISRPSRRPSR